VSGLFPQLALRSLNAMPSVLPFAGIDRRTAVLRVILLSACFVTLLASMPLWSNTRAFPLLPIFHGFPILPGPVQKILFYALLVSLVLASWFYRPAVIFFMAGTFFAFCEDQNRGQPWMYMYWVMLGFTLLPQNVVLAASRCAISVAYVWSGIQKCNTHFFQIVPQWFVAPATLHWHFPRWIVTILQWAVATAPFLELAIGVALWSTRFRRLAIGMVLLVHLSALLFLGPLGYRYDLVVWPWNLAMIALVMVLFPFGTERRAPDLPKAQPKPPQSWSSTLQNSFFSKTLAELRRSRQAVVLVALFAFLPVLSFAGWWDSYFSFTLFAESQAKADIFVTAAFTERAPLDVVLHIHKVRQKYDPLIQGPYVLDFQTWGYKQLHVPPIFEPRNYRSIYRYLCPYARRPDELRMIIAPRAGPLMFYEGDRAVPLSP
jgi:hypothetical protein